MKRILSIITLFLVISCNSSNSINYKIDRIIVLKSRCKVIFENKSDTGFGNCPIDCISIDKNLNIFHTKGSSSSSKLDSYSGHISKDAWNSIYNKFIVKILNDSSEYNLSTLLKKIKDHEIEDLSGGPEFLVLFYRNETNFKTVRFNDRNHYLFRSFFDSIICIERKSPMSKMRDTVLVDLKNYLIMPPQLERTEQIIN